MLPLKLVRSLVLGETLTTTTTSPPSHNHQDTEEPTTSKATATATTTTTTTTTILTKEIQTSSSRTPLLVFLPTRELITDTYKLATIARHLGLDLYPTPSLSHIIFSSSSSSSSPCLSWSSTSLLLPNDSVPLPFPSLYSASISHLRSFVSLSPTHFKVVFINSHYTSTLYNEPFCCGSNWDCCSLSLFSRLTRGRIDSMDGFSKALAGMGWTIFKTRKNPSKKMVYLFRKVDSRRVFVGPQQRNGGECSRIRELRLPTLDFRNAPLRILHYILLMTDDLFYLA